MALIATRTHVGRLAQRPFHDWGRYIALSVTSSVPARPTGELVAIRAMMGRAHPPDARRRHRRRHRRRPHRRRAAGGLRLDNTGYRTVLDPRRPRALAGVGRPAD